MKQCPIVLQNNKYEELKMFIRIQIIQASVFATELKSNGVKLCCKTTNVKNQYSSIQVILSRQNNQFQYVIIVEVFSNL